MLGGERGIPGCLDKIAWRRLPSEAICLRLAVIVSAICLSREAKGEKLLNLLVGAAGFEPATCSTQNCRATRLRYTPPIAEPDNRFGFGRQAAGPCFGCRPHTAKIDVILQEERVFFYDCCRAATWDAVGMW